MVNDILIGKGDAARSSAREVRQPPRHDRRRHRHRQIGVADAAGRGFLQARRAGVPRRRQGRPGRPRRSPARWATSSRRASTSSASTGPRPRTRSSSGTSTASSAIRCAPRSPRWDRPCSARLLELNDTQEGVLEVVFKAADDNGLLLLDLKDLRALLGWAADNAKDISQHYGLISARPRSPRSSARCCRWSRPAATPSSANPRSTSPTSCARTCPAAASSTSSPPTS